MCLLAGVLLLGVFLAGVRLLLVLLAVEGEMVLAESLCLEEKEKIPPEWEIPEEEEESPLFGALFVPWHSWHPFSFAGWTGGHRRLDSWFLPMHWFAATEKEFVNTNVADIKVRSV